MKHPLILHCRRGGFSLIELMIASLILTVGVAALIYCISYSLQKSREPYNRSVAMDLAQQKLEELRNEDYSLLASGHDVNAQGAQISIDPYGQPGGMFTRQWVVQEDTPMAGTKTVGVTVSWQAMQVLSVGVTTIIARPFPEGGG
jgi:prepilin-type N-terminal cleavage/methylation domain-containing protein